MVPKDPRLKIQRSVRAPLLAPGQFCVLLLVKVIAVSGKQNRVADELAPAVAEMIGISLLIIVMAVVVETDGPLLILRLQ